MTDLIQTKDIEESYSLSLQLWMNRKGIEVVNMTVERIQKMDSLIAIRRYGMLPIFGMPGNDQQVATFRDNSAGEYQNSLFIDFDKGY